MVKCGKYEYEWWSVHPKKFNDAMFSSAKSLLNAKNVGIFAFEMAEKKLIGYLNLNYNLWHCSILLWQKPDRSVVRLYWLSSVYACYMHTLCSNVGCLLHKEALQRLWIMMWQLCPDAKPVCYFWSLSCHSPNPLAQGNTRHQLKTERCPWQCVAAFN